MESSDLKVALVGDSVLDNHYWLDRPAEDVRVQTERTLQEAYPSRTIRVSNFAVDESTVACVLRGRAPAAHYRDGRRKARMQPYPMDEDGVVRPLQLLRNTKPTHVVGAWCREPCVCGVDTKILIVEHPQTRTISKPRSRQISILAGCQS